MLAMNGDELVDVDFTALLERHRASGARRRSRSPSRRRSSARSTSPTTIVVTGFHEVSRVPYWVNCGIYVLSAGRHRALSGEGRSRDDDLPGARRRGLAARVPAHRALADREHAEGAPPRRRARDAASGVARMSRPVAFTPRHIDKPWGYELIWAESEDYVGKVLFVRAGQALSLQYHEQKDESWLVQCGRASLELGQVGGELETIEISAGDASATGPARCIASPRSRTRRFSRSRHRTSTTSSGSTTATDGPSATLTAELNASTTLDRVHHRKRDSRAWLRLNDTM